MEKFLEIWSVSFNFESLWDLAFPLRRIRRLLIGTSRCQWIRTSASIQSRLRGTHSLPDTSLRSYRGWIASLSDRPWCPGQWISGSCYRIHEEASPSDSRWVARVKPEEESVQVPKFLVPFQCVFFLPLSAFDSLLKESGKHYFVIRGSFSLHTRATLLAT